MSTLTVDWCDYWQQIIKPSGFPICKPYGSHSGSDAPRYPQMETVDKGTILTKERMNKLWSILRREWNLRGGSNRTGTGLAIGSSGEPDEIVTAKDITNTFRTINNMHNYDVDNYPAAGYISARDGLGYPMYTEAAACDGNPTYCVLGARGGPYVSGSEQRYQFGPSEGTVKYRPYGNADLVNGTGIHNDIWATVYGDIVEQGTITWAEFFNLMLVRTSNLLSNTCVCNCNYCSCFGDEVCTCNTVGRSGWCYAYLF